MLADDDNGTAKPLLGISSCLLGERVRYDGDHKYDALIVEQLGQHFHFRGFCPEMDIGLGVPRPTIELRRRGEQIICVASDDHSLEFTDQLIDCADRQRPWQQQICGYIFKRGSPSCGVARVKLHSGSGEQAQIMRAATGIYAARLMQNFPGLPCEEEQRLADPVLRRAFIEAVYDYRDRQFGPS